MTFETYFKLKQDDLSKSGYLTFDKIENSDINSINNIFQKKNLDLQRDVIISSTKETGGLSATNHDFWFHTDGVFLDPPPRWIMICIEESSAGGEIELLDSKLFLNSIIINEYRYGNADYAINKPILEATINGDIFRYRKDYMGSKDTSSLNRINGVISNYANMAIKVGSLGIGSAILIDNWRLLHRRLPFSGTRTIRRLWWEINE